MEKVKSIFSEKNFQYWGLLGTISMLIALFIPQIGYKGLQNEPYSMLNHYVSQLGELGVSHFALIFNIGIFIGGLLYIPFNIGFGKYIGNRVAKIGIILGIITAIAGSLVGIFPMNYLVPHMIVSMTFFYAGMISIGFFTAGILIQKKPKISRYFSIVGFVVIIIFFMFLSGGFGILTIAIFEWAAVLSIVIFLSFFSIIFTLQKLKKINK